MPVTTRSRTKRPETDEAATPRAGSDSREEDLDFSDILQEISPAVQRAETELAERGEASGETKIPSSTARSSAESTLPASNSFDALGEPPTPQADISTTPTSPRGQRRQEALSTYGPFASKATQALAIMNSIHRTSAPPPTSPILADLDLHGPDLHPAASTGRDLCLFRARAFAEDTDAHTPRAMVVEAREMLERIRREGEGVSRREFRRGPRNTAVARERFVEVMGDLARTGEWVRAKEDEEISRGLEDEEISRLLDEFDEDEKISSLLDEADGRV